MIDARIRAEVLAVIWRIPAGRVATHKQIGAHLKIMPRHVATLLATLDAAECESVPWWRVVADGGAIGRHQRRDDQMQRLRADGIIVAPVGIVQDLAERGIDDIAALLAGKVKAPSTPPKSRARGMRDKPKSSIPSPRPFAGRSG